MKRIILLLGLATLARADTIETTTTTDGVSAVVGCWNPSVCTDPSLFWNAFGLPVPITEPPYDAFSLPGQPSLYDWANYDPAWFSDPPITITAVPEPGVVGMLVVGLILFLTSGVKSFLKRPFIDGLGSR